MKLKMIAAVGGVSLAGIALIGAGASATFTQDTTSSQSITAGTMNVDLSAQGATGNGTPNITLPAAGPESSTFSESKLITITNNGNIPVNEISLKLGDTNNNATLQSETWACFYSDGEVLFNEPLTTVEGYGSGVVMGPVAPNGGTDSYTLVVYAGQIDNGCGAAFSGFDSGSHAYTSWEAYSGAAPALGSNPSAASLTNPAEGGVITPTVTVSYAG